MNIFVASGNLGGDMEVRHTPAGKAVGDFSLPVKQGFGEYEKTSWVSCKILGDRAVKLQQYLTKGLKVTVSGEFVYEEWETDGVKRGKPVVIVRDVDFSAPKSQQAPNVADPVARHAPGQQQPSQSFDNFDQDIPF